LASHRLRRTRLLFVPICLVLLVDAFAWAQRTEGTALAVGAPLERAQLQAPPPAPVTTTTLPAADAGPIPIPADGYAAEPIKLIGTITIPKIGLAHDLYDGVTLHNIDRGPSHWPGTAMPGQPGNAVVAGHRVTHDHPFLDIDKLRPGDLVIFDVGGTRSTYRMTSSEVVSPDAVWIADQTPTPTATLYACHPPHSKTYRYVVHLALVS
jgi:sortase A